MILFSPSPPAPYLATPHLSLHRIGCKHIPSYFAFPIAYRCLAAAIGSIDNKLSLIREIYHGILDQLEPAYTYICPSRGRIPVTENYKLGVCSAQHGIKTRCSRRSFNWAPKFVIICNGSKRTVIKNVTDLLQASDKLYLTTVNHVTNFTSSLKWPFQIQPPNDVERR